MPWPNQTRNLPPPLTCTLSLHFTAKPSACLRFKKQMSSTTIIEMQRKIEKKNSNSIGPVFAAWAVFKTSCSSLGRDTLPPPARPNSETPTSRRSARAPKPANDLPQVPAVRGPWSFCKVHASSSASSRHRYTEEAPPPVPLAGPHPPEAPQLNVHWFHQSHA